MATYFNIYIFGAAPFFIWVFFKSLVKFKNEITLGELFAIIFLSCIPFLREAILLAHTDFKNIIIYRKK